MVRNSLDPDSDFYLDTDSVNVDSKHCSLYIRNSESPRVQCDHAEKGEEQHGGHDISQAQG